MLTLYELLLLTISASFLVFSASSFTPPPGEPCLLYVFPYWPYWSVWPCASIMTMNTRLLLHQSPQGPGVTKSVTARSLSPLPCTVTAATSSTFP